MTFALRSYLVSNMWVIIINTYSSYPKPLVYLMTNILKKIVQLLLPSWTFPFKDWLQTTDFTSYIEQCSPMDFDIIFFEEFSIKSSYWPFMDLTWCHVLKRSPIFVCKWIIWLLLHFVCLLACFHKFLFICSCFITKGLIKVSWFTVECYQLGIYRNVVIRT